MDLVPKAFLGLSTDQRGRVRLDGRETMADSGAYESADHRWSAWEFRA